MIYLIILLALVLFIFNFFIKQVEKFNNKYEFIENNVTLCFKTLYRKDLTNEFIKDVRKLLPNIKIIVVDDSDDDYKKLTRHIVESYNNTLYVPVPFDSGLSYSRNEAVKNVKTKYTLLTDDSRNLDSFKSVDILNNLLSIMEDNSEISVICGNCQQRGAFAGKFTHIFNDIFINNELNNNKNAVKKAIKNKDNIKVKISFQDIDKLKKENFNNLDLYKTHVGMNYFIANTNVLKNHPWVNKLKLQEHKHFFFDLYLDDIQVYYCEDFLFKQYDKYRKYDKQGINMRKRFFKNNVQFKY